ncbi:hypothetical protein ElyMa_005869300, partial [Elysia marginata]
IVSTEVESSNMSLVLSTDHEMMTFALNSQHMNMRYVSVFMFMVALKQASS